MRREGELVKEPMLSSSLTLKGINKVVLIWVVTQFLESTSWGPAVTALYRGSCECQQYCTSTKGNSLSVERGKRSHSVVVLWCTFQEMPLYKSCLLPQIIFEMQAGSLTTGTPQQMSESQLLCRGWEPGLLPGVKKMTENLKQLPGQKHPQISIGISVLLEKYPN